MLVQSRSAVSAPTVASLAGTRATTPDASIWENCREVDVPLTDIEGTLPPDLVGRLLRNGPAKRDLGSCFWDGDAMVRELSFQAGGKARYRGRYIETEKYLAEKHATRPLFRTAGTQRPGGILSNAFRIPVSEPNTHLLPFAGKLLALHEGGHPVALDPVTLATHGPFHFDGKLSRLVTFAAHPHRDPETFDVFNFGVRGAGLGGPAVIGYRLTPQGRLVTIGELPLPSITFMHDFAVTQNWLVFFVPPVSFSMARMLLGVGPVFDAFRWQKGRAAQVLMLSKDGTQTRRFEIEPMILGHVSATRERGDEVVVDFVRGPTWDKIGKGLYSYQTDGFDFTEDMCQWRMRFDTRTKRVQSEELCALPGDFPRGNETRALHARRFAYLAANPAPSMCGFFRGTLKLDLDTGRDELFDFGQGAVTHEPIFVPARGASSEDHGYLVQLVHNSARRATDCVVFDARRVSDGPVCTLRLPVSAGMTFHGTWMA